MSDSNSNAAPASTPAPSVRDRWWGVKFALFLVGVVAVVLFIGFAWAAAKRMSLKVACRNNFKQLGEQLQSYAAAHHGRFPAVWSELNFAAGDTNSLRLLRCRAANHDIGAADRVDVWADYRLLPGRSTNDPPETVLVIEPLANHESTGATVLRVDGTIEWWKAPRVLGLPSNQPVGRPGS